VLVCGPESRLGFDVADQDNRQWFRVSSYRNDARQLSKGGLETSLRIFRRVVGRFPGHGRRHSVEGDSGFAQSPAKISTMGSKVEGGVTPDWGVDTGVTGYREVVPREKDSQGEGRSKRDPLHDERDSI
jgi:hypothetical protein